MRMTFLVCLSILAAGCSGSGKPSDVANDATTSTQSGTNTANSANGTPTQTSPAQTAPSDNTPENPPPGACGGKTCAAGESCVSYYGIAGPRGPQFHDCVIPCRRGTANDGCPSGKRCSTIADGPGDVCQ